MFTDFSTLSSNKDLRHKQLKCLMTLDSIREHLLHIPALIDLDRLEDDLIETVSSLFRDIYKPINL